MAIRVCAIVDPGCEPSTRYRVAQFAPLLASCGVDVEVRPWPRGPVLQEVVLKAVEAADSVVLQRILPERRLLRRIRLSSRRLIYDFDDAVTRYESTRGRPAPNARRWWRFRYVARASDAVCAGSDYLASLARRHAEARRVHVVPTAVDCARYDAIHAPPVSKPVAGWIGARWTLPYLEALRVPLEALSREMADLRVRVIADRAADLGTAAVELVPWSKAGEIAELKRLRVGLAPLPDDSWTRGKCGLRLLQYLAAGVPAVASPVGTQSAIIAAHAALPARTDAEWKDAVRRVLTNDAEAAELVQRGRALVRSRFDVRAVLPLVVEAWVGR